MRRRKLLVPYDPEERKAILAAAYEAAANDPVYVAEMREVDADFEVTVGDGFEDELPGSR